MQIQKLENYIESYDKSNEMFNNPDYNPTNIKWTDICFAGHGEKKDPLTKELQLNPPCDSE